MRNRSLKKGFFITFEGTDGAGKSTLIHQIVPLLNQLGFATLVTREPGGSPNAEKIRQLILENPLDPWSELFLYEASRAEHLTCTILPAIKKGIIVLCDRFTDSSLAYQAYARKLPWKKVQLLNQIATQGIRPDLTVFLDVPPETALQRAKETNRFEAEGLAFQNQVRKGYLKARGCSLTPWLTLKIMDQSPQELANQFFKFMTKTFPKDFKNVSSGSSARS